MRRIALSVLLILAVHTNICLAQNSPATSANPPEVAPAQNSSGAVAADSGKDPSEEKWTELDAVKSGLDPLRIAWAVLAKWEFPGYTRELVRVQWRPNDPIDLYVVRPHGVVRPPVIVYLYGFPADTDRFRQEDWCNFVTKNGFAAAGFVSALTGQRYHTRPMREWFVSELQESLVTSTHDVQMILDYLTNRSDIDTSRVGMLGEGSGGTIAILAAATDPRIAFVDAINPWGDWPDWLKESPIVPEKERARYLVPEFLHKAAMLDPVAYLPRLKPGRIRIEQVADDIATPKSVQSKIAASASNSGDVVLYPDVSAQIRVWVTQNSWLKEQLQPSPVTRSATEVGHNDKKQGPLDSNVPGVPPALAGMQ